jgi:hypothetical protein
MTREEKKLIRLQVISLLERCRGCKFRSITNASIHVCPGCPIGQQMQELGKKLAGPPKPASKQEQKKKTLVMRPWTKEEEEFVLMNQHRMTRIEMAKRLGRSYDAVRQKLAKLNAQRGRIHAS